MSRLPRKNAISLGELLKDVIKAEHLDKGLNMRRVFAAWDQASGAEKYTIKKYFRDGKLYITVSSSVIRSQLLFQKAALVEKMNSILSEDEISISELILK